MALNVPKPQFQDPLRSTVVRTADTEFENAINDQQNQIDAIIAPSAGNLIANGTFATDTIWTKGTGWTIGSGVASCDGTQGGTTDLSQASTIKIGQTIIVTFEITAFTAGTVTPFGGTAAGTARSSVGTFTENIVVTGSETFILQGDASFIGSVDNVTVFADEVENARDNFDVLRDRIRANGLVAGTELITGGEVTEQSVPDLTVPIAAGKAVINGIGVKWDAQNSGTVTAPSVNPRLDYIVANSDNSISIVAGSELADPVFPSISASQLVLACLVMKTGTTSLNEDVEIFTLEHGDRDLPDHYIGTTKTINQGQYVFNNLIIDAAVTLDVAASTTITGLQRGLVMINCRGNYQNTVTGTIAVAASHLPSDFDGNDGIAGVDAPSGGTGAAASAIGYKNTHILNLGSGKGGDGGFGQGDVLNNRVSGGGGGSGGTNILFAGGAGGDAGITEVPSNNDDNRAGGVAITQRIPFLYITALDVRIFGNITISGGDGPDGVDGGVAAQSGGGGGAGGASGGILFLMSKGALEINTSITIDATGGDGGDGGDSTLATARAAGGGGGGGGGGGIIVIRSKTFSNNGTITIVGGSAGAGGTASGASTSNDAGSVGSAGSGGLSDQALYDDIAASLLDNRNPLNIFGFDLL